MSYLRAEKPRRIAAISALVFIGLVTLGAFAALAVSAAEGPSLSDIFSDPYLIGVIRFTLWQAVLSAVLSIALAIPTARAFARQQNFPGRSLFLKLFALPLALPALVGVLAVLGLWGKAGWINQLTGQSLTFSIFGLIGILLAHVFFNLPLATRLLVTHLEQIPVENWRLASQLAMPPRTIFKIIEWPVMKSALPGIFALIFMLCLTSFTIVLVLGGGPASTTLEVAIYQSLRFDFDPGKAVTLALIQLAITIIVLAVSFRFTKNLPHLTSFKHAIPRPDAAIVYSRVMDGFFIVLSALFVTLPLLVLVINGLTSDMAKLLAKPALWKALATSLWLAIAAAMLATTLCWTMLSAISNEKSKFAQLVNFSTSAVLVMPAIVLGSGWFVLLHKTGDVFTYTPLLVIVINALMALPFIYRILGPAMAQATRQHVRLVASLGITGWARFKLIDFPVLKKPVLLAFAFAMALSIGDLGVIALFSSEQITTLPLLLFRSLGSYRTHDADALALILAVTCLVILYGAAKLANEK